MVGNLRLTSVVRYQIEHGWFIAPFVGDWMNPWKWLLAIPMIISFLVFMIAIFAETNRLPFDLPEAEQELAGGYHTEYSSMKFALIFSRRIRRDDHRLGCHRHIILWGLAFPWNSRRLTWMDIRSDQHGSLFRKSEPS